MTAFATAVDLLFADPNLAEDAIYQPLSGGDSAVRIVLRKPPEAFDALQTGARRSDARIADIRKAEIEAPKKGDRLEAGALAFKVRAARLDGLGLVWTLDLDPAA